MRMKFSQVLSVLVAMSMAAFSVPATAEDAASSHVSGPSDQADAPRALAALQQLLAAYAAGQQAAAEALIEPQMIGYSRVADAVREAGQGQKQLRLNLSDTRALVSDDVVVIRTHWEKRYLSLPALAPVIKSGTCSFVMHRDAGSGGAAWRLSALSGDNPFAPD